VTAPAVPQARAAEFTLLQRIRGWVTNPWGRPRFLPVVAWAYIVWSILPVVIAIQFSFNDSRSLTAWSGFSTRWYWGNVQSVWGNTQLHSALAQSIRLAFFDVLISVPLGVLLALGLARWRGRGAGSSNFLMLFPLITPEIVMGVSLFLLFTHLFTFIHTSTTAQILGHVTFSISYVVVIVRGRLFSIGRHYEEAAADLGASPSAALRLVLLPLLLPAIIAGIAITFAISIDDFVISYYLSCGGACDTVPIIIYSSARGGPQPSTNAIASIMVFLTLITVMAGYLLYRAFTRGERGTSSAMASDLGAFEL
jgi:spermidine/putrescine transport system permease protein